MSNFLSNIDHAIIFQNSKEDPKEKIFNDEELTNESLFELKTDELTDHFSNSPDEYSRYVTHSSDDLYNIGMHNIYENGKSTNTAKNSQVFSSINQNSKKIKREAAKQRAQMKKSCLNHLQSQGDTKNQQSTYDNLSNMNLDDQPNRKLKQMIRNRLSAQNSRDRKKAYIANLENSNRLLQVQYTKLLNEINILKALNKKIGIENEQLSNKIKSEGNLCPNCGYSLIQSPSENSTDEHISIQTPVNEIGLDHLNTEDNDTDSPLFTRLFRSSPRSFFNYMLAFAAVFSLIAIMNINGNLQNTQIGSNKFYVVGPLKNITTEPRNLVPRTEIMPVIIEQSAIDVNSRLAAPLNMPFLRDILSSQTYFNDNAITTFFSELKANDGVIHPCPENIEITKQNIKIEPKTSGDEDKLLMEYNFLGNEIERRNNIIQKKSLILSSQYDPNKKNKFSTLYCPAGFEFFNIDKEKDGINPQNLLESQYIQLYIPKKQIQGVFKSANRSDIIIPTFANPGINSGVTAEDNNDIIEIWCKVFQIREFSSNIQQISVSQRFFQNNRVKMQIEYMQKFQLNFY